MHDAAAHARIALLRPAALIAMDLPHVLFPVLGIGWLDIAFIIAASLATSVVHGASGIAGGFLMAACLAPIIGIKDVMPALSVTMLITGSTRSLMSLGSINWPVLLTLIVPAVPAVLVVGSFYGSLSSSFVAGLLGVVMLVSLALRRVADRLRFRVRRRDIAIVGGIWGALTGASIGPGLLVVPVLMNCGLRREALVITLSAAAILVHVFRITAYAGAGQLTAEPTMLGVLIGLLSIPGNWVGRGILRRISDDQHVVWIEGLLALGALNFFWIALR